MDSVWLRREVKLGERWCRLDGASVMSDMSRLLLFSRVSSSAFASCNKQCRQNE